MLDEKKGLVNHIYDVGTKRFIREKVWATGNGWALLGIARVADFAEQDGNQEVFQSMLKRGKAILDAMLCYQLPDGRFHDILDDTSTFVEGTAAMMMATYIYRGCKQHWLSEEYLKYAEQIAETMEKYIDEYGIIQEVCGCPDFLTSGTSAESLAAYLMMHAWRNK